MRSTLSAGYTELARLQRSAELADDAATLKCLHTYLAASLYPGKIGERLKDAEYQLFRTIAKAMAKQGVRRKEIQKCLNAPHVQERNAQI